MRLLHILVGVHVCMYLQLQAQAVCTYSVCNKPVRSIPIFISELLTLSSDNACQISPQDFLKNNISPRLSHLRQLQQQQTKAAITAFLLAWVVNIKSGTALQIDGTTHYCFFCTMIDSYNNQHLIYCILTVLLPTLSTVVTPSPPCVVQLSFLPVYDMTTGLVVFIRLKSLFTGQTRDCMLPGMKGGLFPHWLSPPLRTQPPPPPPPSSSSQCVTSEKSREHLPPLLEDFPILWHPDKL